MAVDRRVVFHGADEMATVRVEEELGVVAPLADLGIPRAVHPEAVHRPWRHAGHEHREHAVAPAVHPDAALVVAFEEAQLDPVGDFGAQRESNAVEGRRRSQGC